MHFNSKSKMDLKKHFTNVSVVPTIKVILQMNSTRNFECSEMSKSICQKIEMNIGCSSSIYIFNGFGHSHLYFQFKIYFRSNFINNRF